LNFWERGKKKQTKKKYLDFLDFLFFFPCFREGGNYMDNSGIENFFKYIFPDLIYRWEGRKSVLQTYVLRLAS